MFSVIIPTADSERALVPTLAALVPGATAGIVREVIVTDGESRDQTEEVADIAGCRFVSSAKPLGIRLSEAAKGARGDWLSGILKATLPTVIAALIAFAASWGVLGNRVSSCEGGLRDEIVERKELAKNVAAIEKDFGSVKTALPFQLKEVGYQVTKEIVEQLRKTESKVDEAASKLPERR